MSMPPMKTPCWTLADHLPAEAAEALLELATGGKPQLPQVVAPTADPFDHPDALRRFRMMGDVDELARALEYPWEKVDHLPSPGTAADCGAELQRPGPGLRFCRNRQNRGGLTSRRVSGQKQPRYQGSAGHILRNAGQCPENKVETATPQPAEAWRAN